MKMHVEIRKLTPDLVEDYLHFFDTTPHSDAKGDIRCYCVCWCNDDSDGKDYSSNEKRRAYAHQYVTNGNIQGYLAYCDDQVVGWCNANTKSDCLKCISWRRFKGQIPVEEPGSGIRVKSIFCFTIAPERKRMGIATRLLERVCQDAATDGFDYAEAYPNKEFVDVFRDFMGPTAMYEKNGFTVQGEAGDMLVMRKKLNS
jgi:GNAT superfamily N-acetyltransferase